MRRNSGLVESLPYAQVINYWERGTLSLAWWRHQMKTFSALLALSARNSPVNGECPSQRLVTRSFDVFFDLRLARRLSNQWWGWWFETPSCPLWRHWMDQADHLTPITTHWLKWKYPAWWHDFRTKVTKFGGNQYLWCYCSKSLWWRHNGCDGFSNHQAHECLLNRLFKRRTKKTSGLRVTGLCEGNSPLTGEFPAQRASDA